MTLNLDRLTSILLTPLVLTVTAYVHPADTSSSREISDQLARAGRVTLILTLEDGLGAGRGGDAARRRTPLAARKIAYARCQDACVAALAGSSVRIKYRYRYSPALAVEISDAAAQKLVQQLPGVRRVTPDAQGRGVLDVTRERIRADRVHDLGITGEGCVVAVLDSGADFDHPDLDAAIIPEFAYHFLSQGEDTGDGADDGHDHGSHVTGIIASRGQSVAPLGVAPASRIVPVKILDDNNRGWFSDWAAGLDYAVAIHEADNGLEIDVINMSISSNAEYPGICDNTYTPIFEAATAARELGIAIFAASGNGFSSLMMSMPACMTPAFSVGATVDFDSEAIALFTNRNELLDVVAPGFSVISASHDGGVTTISGTSQATPHVVGVACLLLEADPTLTPDEILEILKVTGRLVFDSRTGLTFSRVDALAAVGAVLVPQATGLACEFVPERRTLTITWGGVDETETVSIVLSRDGETIHEEVVSASETSWSRVDVLDGEYEAVVTAHDGTLSGLPSLCSTSVTPGALFRRGDCNDDEAIDITDPVATLHVLFVEREFDIPCLRACDTNDDHLLNVTDAVYSLGYLFQAGPAPLPPFPNCGTDETPEEPIIVCVTPHCE